jgi:hypothetical protein
LGAVVSWAHVTDERQVTLNSVTQQIQTAAVAGPEQEKREQKIRMDGPLGKAIE